MEQYLQEYYQEYSKPCQFRGSNDLVADIAQRQACKEAKIAAMKAGFRSHIWIFPSSWKAFSHSPKELQRAVEAAFWWFTPSPGHEGCKPKELQIFPSPETVGGRITERVLTKQDVSVLADRRWTLSAWQTGRVARKQTGGEVNQVVRGRGVEGQHCPCGKFTCTFMYGNKVVQEIGGREPDR